MAFKGTQPSELGGFYRENKVFGSPYFSWNQQQFVKGFFILLWLKPPKASILLKVHAISMDEKFRSGSRIGDYEPKGVVLKQIDE